MTAIIYCQPNIALFYLHKLIPAVGLTRAKKLALIVGSEKAVAIAVKQVKQRASGYGVKGKARK